MTRQSCSVSGSSACWTTVQFSCSIRRYTDVQAARNDLSPFDAATLYPITISPSCGRETCWSENVTSSHLGVWLTALTAASPA